jgi:hypothetical protein
LENVMNLVCLIVEPVVLIAADLSAVVEEVMPGTTVVAVSTMPEAEAALHDLGTVDIAFLNTPPTDFTATPLADALGRVSAVVVFLGYEADAEAIGARYLERPFLGEAVAAELRRVRDGLAGGVDVPADGQTDG